MLPEIITFNKTMEFRLEEYEQLLDGIETPCSDIIEIWGSTLADLAVIGTNWQAVWILSEENCEKYNVLFPTAVIVNVEEFQCSDLMATVNVIAVQEDIELPSLLDVPVIELHPIKNQNYDETDLRDIEDWLDKCRYFFNHLWYSWDAKSKVTLMDWCDAHLQNRLKMQYDLKHGVFDKRIAVYLKQLLSESRNCIDSESERALIKEDNRISAVSKYIRKQIVKTELKLFEDPYLRYGIIQLKKKEKRLRNSISPDLNEVKFIWLDGTCECLGEYVKKTQSLLEKNTPIKVFGALQDALDASNTKDVIILSPGEHTMTSFKGIENGGTIKGWDAVGTQIIPDISAMSKAILCECFGHIELANITISKSNGITIQVFEGILTLTKCRLISKKNSTSRGIVVVSGSKVILEKCEVEGFGTAIAVQGNAQATLIDTKISNCHEGIKVTENAVVMLDKVDICSCTTYGIRVESSKVESTLVGNLNLIEGNNWNCQITGQYLNMSDNVKGNVIIKQIENTFNVEELSESVISNEVICISDGDISDNSIELM